MTIAEIVSELINSGVTLSEVAGLTNERMRWIYFRARNKDGTLVKEDRRLRRRNMKTVPFKEMFKAVWASRGQDAEAKWQEYLMKNRRHRNVLERN